MNYLITISYDGTNYYGFQRLNSKKTIQQEIEGALSIINKKPVKIKGAGRTDKGVHAYGQRASFKLDVNVPADRLINAINSLLPMDIRITACEVVADNFHARYNVKKKTYLYKINNGLYDPLINNYYYQFNYHIDLRKLKTCAKLFKGVHYFNNFVSGTRDNYEAIIYKIIIKKTKDIILIEFIGHSFYRYMVRNLVGAMLDYATDKVSLETIKNMLNNYNISQNLSCAPANGLYLMKIDY